MFKIKDGKLILNKLWLVVVVKVVVTWDGKRERKRLRMDTPCDYRLTRDGKWEREKAAIPNIFESKHAHLRWVKVNSRWVEVNSRWVKVNSRWVEVN
eukprot:c24372_g2_i1 orf=47-337(+)